MVNPASKLELITATYLRDCNSLNSIGLPQSQSGKPIQPGANINYQKDGIESSGLVKSVLLKGQLWNIHTIDQRMVLAKDVLDVQNQEANPEIAAGQKYELEIRYQHGAPIFNIGTFSVITQSQLGTGAISSVYLKSSNGELFIVKTEDLVRINPIS